MSMINKIFGLFKHKEEINKTIEEVENTSPLIVEEKEDSPAMVRADNFDDSAVIPEEYKVAEEDDVEETVDLEEDSKLGITVDDGDDMSPIIMDSHEEIVSDENDIDKVINDPTHSIKSDEVLEENEILKTSDDIEVL